MLFVVACSCDAVTVLDSTDWQIEEVSTVLAKRLAGKVEGITAEGIRVLSIEQIYKLLKTRSLVLQKTFTCIYNNEFLIYDNGTCFSIMRLDKDTALKDSKVVIPYGVQAITASTFEGCKDLKEIVFPDTLSVIEKYAFCSASVERIDLNKVSVIDESAFANSGLYEVEIPSTVQVLGSGAFAECHNLMTVCFKGAIKEIQSRAFSGANLKKVRFYGAVGIIGASAFWGTKLSRVTIPKGSKVICGDAFLWSPIKNLVFYGDMEDIAEYAFTFDTMRTIEVKGSSSTNFKIDTFLKKAELNSVTIFRG